MIKSFKLLPDLEKVLRENEINPTFKSKMYL